MEYPKCLYLGNVLYAAFRIVKDEGEEAMANEEGYGVDADDDALTEKGMTKAQLKDALTEKGVQFASNASKGDLQSLYDALPQA